MDALQGLFRGLYARESDLLRRFAPGRRSDLVTSSGHSSPSCRARDHLFYSVHMTGEHDEQLSTVAKRVEEPRAAQPLRLSVQSGDSQECYVTTPGTTVVIGRSAACDIHINDPTASSFHAEIAACPGGVLVRDLSSLNGTLYRGARLESAVVPPGALLQLGSTVVRIDLESPVETPAEQQAVFGRLIAASRTMRELFSLLARLARTDLALLVEGPTGTGKELVARAVHQQSTHAQGPFVVLDCTAVPASLAESVIFGHERGAFTGADARRPGVFEAAADGTLFIDEIGELPLELQPKLLRALEQREVVRVGGARPIPIRARIISATWRDLRARVNQKLFREDLYFRLAQSRVAIPPLAKRPEDIPVLIQHFLDNLPASTVAARRIAPDALKELCRREFPGNVRELRHTVERAAMLAEGEVIAGSDLAFERMLMGERTRTQPAAATAPPAADGNLPLFKEAKRTLIDEFESDYLQRLLTRTGRNLSRASALAGIERHHLRDLLRKHGLYEKD